METNLSVESTATESDKDVNPDVAVYIKQLPVHFPSSNALSNKYVCLSTFGLLVLVLKVLFKPLYLYLSSLLLFSTYGNTDSN